MEIPGGDIGKRSRKEEDLRKGASGITRRRI
jgi:hypothetical protein